MTVPAWVLVASHVAAAVVGWAMKHKAELQELAAAVLAAKSGK